MRIFYEYRYTVHTKSSKWAYLLTNVVIVILLVGEMAFSTFCQILEFWLQGSGSESKEV